MHLRFAPTDDVRNSSRAELGAFVTSRLRRFIDEALVMKLVDHYVKDHASSPFEPQRIYSEMVADATVVRCSPRISARPPVPLNSSASSPLVQLGEASDYWHKQVVNRTRCRRHATAGPPLAACLLSLNASELIAAQPPNWHPDAFGFGVFDSTYQYAPLLLIDGEGGVLPEPYVDASGGAPARILFLLAPRLLTEVSH